MIEVASYDLKRIRPVEAYVDCGDDRHLITWSDGALRLCDHDVEPEKVAATLGGELPVCLEILTAWPWDDYEIETLDALAGWAKGSVDLLTRTGLATAVAKMAQGAIRSVTVSKVLERRFQLGLLNALPEELKGVLACLLFLKTRDKWVLPDFRRHYGDKFQQVIAGKVLPALGLSAAGAGLRLGPRTTFACWITEPGEAPSISGWAVSGGAGAAVTVSFDWLVSIWGRSLAVVDGAFVLEILDESDSRIKARVVTWETNRGTITPVVGAAVVAEDEHGWHIAHLG